MSRLSCFHEGCSRASKNVGTTSALYHQDVASEEEPSRHSGARRGTFRGVPNALITAEMVALARRSCCAGAQARRRRRSDRPTPTIDEVPAAPLTLAYLADPDSVHTRRWIGYFATHGHSVHLLVPRGVTPAPGLPAEIALHEFNPFHARRFRPVGMLSARRSLRAILSAIRPDVLHAQYLTVHGWHAWLAGIHPYAITVWGSDVYRAAQQSPQARFMAWLVLHGADLVTADSVDLGRAATASGARPDRLMLAQFGVDTERFRPGPSPAGIRLRLGLDGRRVILAPRIIGQTYRTLVALETLGRLPEDVVMILSRMAAHPDYLAGVERAIDELGLRSRVRLLPAIPHDEMPDFYRLADVVLSIPESDGTPVTLLEAMASGSPVVATALPSVVEWLGDLAPEAMVPVDDPDATATAVTAALLMSTDRRDVLAARFRERVLERADYQRSMQAVEAAYRSLVANDGARSGMPPSG